MSWLISVGGFALMGFLGWACLAAGSWRSGGACLVIAAAYANWIRELWRRHKDEGPYRPNAVFRASCWALGLTALAVFAAVVIPNYVAVHEYQNAKRKGGP